MSMEQAELQKKLATYEANLASMEEALKTNPHNPQYIELRNNLKEYIDLTRDLLGINEKPTSFAPSAQKAKPVTLKSVEVGQYVQVQHGTDFVNAVVLEAPAGAATCTISILGTKTTDNVKISALQPPKFVKIESLAAGTQCEAIYSDDGLWYKATVDEVNADGTCKVTYTEYGNTEIVDVKHIKIWQVKAAADGSPAGKAHGGAGKKRKEAEESTIADGDFMIPEKLKILPTDTEEVRALKKKKIHALRGAHRLKKSETEKNEKAQSWAAFTTKAGKSKKTGFMSTLKKDSIFKTTDNGKVGVTGSGQGTTQWKQVDIHSVKARKDVQDDDDE